MDDDAHRCTTGSPADPPRHFQHAQPVVALQQVLSRLTQYLAHHHVVELLHLGSLARELTHRNPPVSTMSLASLAIIASLSSSKWFYPWLMNAGERGQRRHAFGPASAARVATDQPDTQLKREVSLALRELMQVAPDLQAALAARLGVGTTDVAALDHLVSSPAPLGVVELADLLGMRSASATVLVDRLVHAGHLERAPHPTDRRRVALLPTTSAVAEVREALLPLIAAIDAITAQLDSASAETVRQFLNDVTSAIHAFAATELSD